MSCEAIVKFISLIAWVAERVRIFDQLATRIVRACTLITSETLVRRVKNKNHHQ